MQKSAYDIAFENAYWDELAKQASAYENSQTEQLFDAAFNSRIEKLAAHDPEFAAILGDHQVKMAFDNSFYQTCAQYGVQL